MENIKDYGQEILEAFHKFGAADAKREYDSGRYETLLTLLKAPVEASVRNAAEAEARADAAADREAKSNDGFKANEKRRSDAEKEAREWEAKIESLKTEHAELEATIKRLEGNMTFLRATIAKEAAA
jgi:chromosome segregation ATPase